MMQACTLLLFLLPVQVSLLHTDLPVPQNVMLKKDLVSQTLSLTWESDSSFFDIEIFRTELEELVLNETVLAQVNSVRRRQEWRWHSDVPLECTSHSLHIRARHQHTVSQWSPLLIIPGSDLPEKAKGQMYPQDMVVAVGSSVTFCCILPEGQAAGRIRYMNKDLNETMLSRRTLGATVVDLPASRPTGTNIICSTPLNSVLTGAVVFVGYPPGDVGLECETRDLVSAECHWSKGRDTHLWKISYQTKYTLNGRLCVEASRDRKQCHFDQWQDSWTLVAVNPLGAVQLNDSARLTERVRLTAPVNVSAVAQAWNASLQWTWPLAMKTLAMICQVHLTNRGRTHTRNYTGVGLCGVVLDGLMPYDEYSVSVCCASLHNFWQWGDCSAPYSIRTRMARPKAPDMWVWMDSEDTGRVLWKPLSISASHGPLLGFEVYQVDGEEAGWKTLSLPPNVSSAPISISNTSRDVFVAMAARNPVGLSERSVLAIQEFRADAPVRGSDLMGHGGHLELSWSSRPNATLGYVLEWVPTCCTDTCTIQWVKLPHSNTSTVIQSGTLLDGVRYTFSVFALSHEATVLLQRHHGYGQELVSAQPVGALSAEQSGSSVLLSWDPIPVCHQTGFVHGYTIYRSDASHWKLIAQLTDPTDTSYTIEGLTPGSYKFMVMPYTSAGQASGTTIAIKMESDTDMLVVEILVALGVMSCSLIIISIFCYKKREWVKKAFYPEIPGPKLTGDWTPPAGPLDVKPQLHSLVHIVESPEWESSKGTLVTVPEEEDEDSASQNIDMDTDSDEPALLRYYNQLVSDGSHSNHVSDSSGASTSSVDSAQTQVTYTGIQSPAPSQDIQSPAPSQDIQSSSLFHDSQSPIFSQGTPSCGYRPQMQPTVGLDGPGAGLECLPHEENSNVGYKPQCSWQVDSPEVENLSGSLGSPTSVTSSQFLIPESSEENLEASGTWLQNLLSGKF